MDTVLQKPNLQNLRKIRLDKGFTCLDMSNALGLKTHSAYSKKEQGDIDISLQESQIISNLLGDTVDNIFFPQDVQK